MKNWLVNWADIKVKDCVNSRVKDWAGTDICHHLNNFVTAEDYRTGGNQGKCICHHLDSLEIAEDKGTEGK